MTEITSGVEESHDTLGEQTEALNKLDINALRTFAKYQNIKADRSWTKEDFITALQARQGASTVGLVFDSGTGPKPGYSRILLHRDTSAGHKNSSVHVAVNGAIFAIPRGIEVDVPTFVVGALNDARGPAMSHIEESTGPGRYVENMQQSYPFQVVATNPGKTPNRNDTRAKSYEIRLRCKEAIGKWPTHGELSEWLKYEMQKKANTNN